MAEILDEDGGMAPAMPQNVKLLKAVVIGLGVLLVLGSVVLVTTLITRLNARASSAPVSAEISLPPGAEILESHIDQGHLLMRMRISGAEEIRFYDAATGAQTGVLKLKDAAKN
jgi:hypothetical protein